MPPQKNFIDHGSITTPITMVAIGIGMSFSTKYRGRIIQPIVSIIPWMKYRLANRRYFKYLCLEISLVIVYSSNVIGINANIIF